MGGFKGIRAGVRINNLRKVYDVCNSRRAFLIVICLIQNGKVAVHDLSFNMYENQITALLGQVCRAASVMITC